MFVLHLLAPLAHTQAELAFYRFLLNSSLNDACLSLSPAFLLTAWVPGNGHTDYLKTS